MKKSIIVSLIILSAVVVGYLLLARIQNHAEMAQDITVFFDYAQEQLPKKALEVENTKKTVPVDQVKLSQLQAELQTFTIVNAIANRDVQALKDATPEQLHFADGQVWVDGTKFKETMGGRLASRILYGENALAFVLFHSIMDTTPEQKKQTLEMINALIEKKLNPHSQAGLVLWIKEKASDTHALDYPAIYSLSEIAALYSPKKVQALINDYIQSSGK